MCKYSILYKILLNIRKKAKEEENTYVYHVPINRNIIN